MALFGGKKEKSLTPQQLTGLMQNTANTFLKGLGIKVDPTYTDSQADEIIRTVGKYNPWLAGSIRAILRNIIQPSLKVYDPRTGEDVDKPEYLAVLQEPNPWMDHTGLRKFLSFDNLYNGNGYAIKLRIGDKLGGLLPINAESVQVDTVDNGTAIRYNIRVNGGTVKQYSASDIVHWKDNDFGASYLVGYGLAHHLAYSLALANNADRYNVKSFENGGELKGVLTSDQPLNDQDIEIVEAQLKKRYGGADNAGKTAIFGAGLSYQRTGQNNVEMGFEQLKNISKKEIISITKVPPIELGDYDNANYSNAEIQRKLFWETCLIPMLQSLAAVLTKSIIRDEFKDNKLAYYFDTSDIAALREDNTAKINTVLSMQYAGYSNEQIGRMLDIEPPETNPAETIAQPVQTTEAPKSFTKAIILPETMVQAHNDFMRTEWLKMHGINEKPYRDQLEKWVLGQRNTFLDWFKGRPYSKAKGDDIFNDIYKFIMGEAEEDIAKLQKFSFPAFERINETAVKRMIEEYRLRWVSGEKALITINDHVSKVKIVDDTVKSQALAAIRSAITSGIEAGEDTGYIADKIREAAIHSYGISKRRAFTIARTETTALANDLSNMNYKENGVPKKKWITSLDELVRHAHKDAEGQTVSYDAPFHVGGENLRYPGDMTNGSAGNVINCRCTTVPELD